MRELFRLILAASVLTISGCGSLVTQYGEFRGGTSDISLNGLGVMRRSFEKAGWESTKVSRLGDRAEALNTIVWAPTSAETLYDDARDWFESWLSTADRTLVYLVPDDGCELAYLEQARLKAAPEQQLAYRRRIAQVRTNRMLAHLQRQKSVVSGWMELKPLRRNALLSHPQPDHWPLDTKTNGKLNDAAQLLSGVHYELQPLSTVASSTGGSGQGTTGYSSQPSYFYKYSITPSNATDLKLTPLVVSDQNEIIVGKLTSSDWGKSKVIVVSGGSLLCNFSLTKQVNQDLLAHLIQECGTSPGEFGFMLTGAEGANVSSINQEISRALGLETLTTWPLNVIMLNLVLIGFIACMILIPIFGRPQRLLSKSTHDFADHLDAVAALMYKSGGEVEARRRISDYMRRVRGEQSGPWVVADTAPTTMSPPLSSNQSQVLAPATPVAAESVAALTESDLILLEPDQSLSPTSANPADASVASAEARANTTESSPSLKEPT